MNITSAPYTKMYVTQMAMAEVFEISHLNKQLLYWDHR